MSFAILCLFKEFVYLTKIGKSVGIKLYLIFPYSPFKIFRICSDAISLPSLISIGDSDLHFFFLDHLALGFTDFLYCFTVFYFRDFCSVLCYLFLLCIFNLKNCFSFYVVMLLKPYFFF